MEKKEKKIMRGLINFSTREELNRKLLKKVDKLEEKAYKKQLEKENQKVQKQQEKAEKKKVKEENKASLKEVFSNISLKRDDFEEENSFWYFTNEERTEDYEVLPITIERLADANKKPFEKKLKGQELLKRNLKASPLYILDDDNIIKVEKIQRVFDYDDNNNKEAAYVMLETKYQDFVIEYNIVCTF